MFNKAIKQEAKLRLAIAGPSGSGKTYTSLAIASGLGGKIALVDTERGSASKYADLFDFDVLNLEPPFHPDRFIQAIREAQAAGYAILILDSVSQLWTGTGGMLEVVDQIATRMNTKNTFAAWKEGTPIYNKLVDAIVQSDIHIIATMRSKQDYVLEQDERGKNVPKKVGMAPIMRDGFEYEFDVVVNMDNENIGRVSKTRCPELEGKAFKDPGKDVADILRVWLTGAKRVETTDALGDKAVAYAAKEWNISPAEARESIEAAIKQGKLDANPAKDDFKAFVKGAPELFKGSA